MTSLLAEARDKSNAIVEFYQKAAARKPQPQQSLPDVGTAMTSRQDSLFGGSSGSAADNYRMFRHWVYCAVHAIADRVAGLAWEAAEITNASENPERSYSGRRWQKVPKLIRQKANKNQELKSIASHEVLDLLNRPNSLQRKYEHIYFTVANLEIAGEAYWILGMEEDRDEEALFAVPSHWMRYNRKEKMYELRVSGNVNPVMIPPEFVARCYFPNPSDPLACYSPLNACYSAIKVDDYIQRSQALAFERGIHPNLIVTVGNDPGTGKRPTLTGAQRRQFIRAIREIWSQTVNIGDPAIVDGLIDSVHKLHATPQEMDWPASGEIVKKRIAQTYRVNPYILGEISGVNRAQAVVAEQHFCFLSDTPVITKRGWLPICDVRVGDEVVTHQGRWMPVTETFSRLYDGDVYSVVTDEQKNPVVCTAKHKWWAKRDGLAGWNDIDELDADAQLCIPSLKGEEVREVLVSDYISVHRLHEQNKKYMDRQWLESVVSTNTTQAIAVHCGTNRKEIEKQCQEFGIQTDRLLRKSNPLEHAVIGEFVVLNTRGFRKPLRNRITINTELAFCLGLYVAEGTSCRAQVEFALNRSELNYANRIIESFRHSFGVTGRIRERPHKSIVVEFYSVVLSKLFGAWFGTRSHRKRIPSFVYSFPIDCMQHFIAGYFAGDGYCNLDRRVFDATTTSPSLAYGISFLASQIGWRVSVSRKKTQLDSIAFGNAIKPKHQIYHVQIAAGEMRAVSTIIGVEPPPRKRNQPALKPRDKDDAGYWCHPRTERRHFTGTVYNICVDTDHSFCTAVGVAKNCNGVVNPIAGTISDMATDFLGPRYQSPARLLVYLEEAISEDPDYLLRVWSTLRRNDDVTQDEIRAEILGLPPLEKREDQSALLQLVGGFSGIVTLLQQIGEGLITVEQAVSLLMYVMRLPEDQARAIIGEPPPPRPQVLQLPFQQQAVGEEPEEEEDEPEPAEEEDQDDDEDEPEDEEKRARPTLKSADPDADKAARRKAIEAIRVKQFEEAAVEMEDALADAFAESVAGLISSLKSGWTPDPENAEEQAAKLLDKHFDPAAETKGIMEAAVVPAMRAFGAGVEQQREEGKAVRQMAKDKGRKGKKKSRSRTGRKMLRKPTTAEEFAAKYDLDIPDLADVIEEFEIGLRLPDWMIETAFENLDDTFSRDYWQKVGETTRNDVQITLRNGIAEGKGSREIMKEILEKHGEEYTKARAMAVARTETGSMMNSGHSAGIEELAEETGLEIKAVWLSALSATTRDSHAALHDTPADEEGMFELGGVRVPWPSHPDLPAEERINCMCSVVSDLA